MDETETGPPKVTANSGPSASKVRYRKTIIYEDSDDENIPLSKLKNIKTEKVPLSKSKNIKTEKVCPSHTV